MRFIDLFAGLGGFNLALTELGHTCVFACEKEAKLRDVYKKNFGIVATEDIRDVRPEEVPKHEILCAGFPCQPFSKAGEQEGFDCPSNGDLFEHVMAIVRYHKPKYLLLENVANLRMHNQGKTWVSMERKMRRAGYHVKAERLSPHKFGIPQVRDRLFIVAARGELDNFAWPSPKRKLDMSIENILDDNPKDARRLSPQTTACLEAWQNFLDAIPAGVELPACPIWTMEFGATYPFADKTPYAMRGSLSRYRGSFGQPLKGQSVKQALTALPSYARTKRKKFPAWKIRFIQQNRDFYQANKRWIDKWLPSIKPFPASLQKLEWNCKGEDYFIWDFVIQFRASGVRVKRRTTSPSLIAMTTTQVPIIGWEERYVTPRECARLQSMDKLKHLPTSAEAAFAAFGNAVNVKVVRLVAEALVGKAPAKKLERHTTARRESRRTAVFA